MDNSVLTVTKILHVIGAPASIRGFTFLQEAITRSCADPSLLRSLSSRLYPEIAKEHGTTWKNVERVIRYVLEQVWDHGNPNALTEILGFTPFVAYNCGRPPIKEFIAVISDSLIIGGVKCA